MTSEYRFTLDLVGLFVSVLSLALALVFMPVLSVRVVFGLLALLFLCSAWACSLWDSLDSGSGVLFPLLCVSSIGGVVLCLAISFVAVLAW